MQWRFSHESFFSCVCVLSLLLAQLLLLLPLFCYCYRCPSFCLSFSFWIQILTFECFKFRLVEFMERWTQWTISVWPRGRPFQFFFIVYTQTQHVQCVSDVFIWENNSVLSSYVPVVILYAVQFGDFINSLFCSFFFLSIYLICFFFLSVAHSFALFASFTNFEIFWY